MSLNILHIETGRNLYGGALQVIYLMKGLAQRGWHNHLICCADSAVGKQAGRWGRVTGVPSGGDIDPRLLYQMVRIIRADCPDILHVHCRRGADFWGALAARITGIPSIITRRVDNPEPRLPAAVKYGGYNAIVAISHGVGRALQAAGLAQEQISRIPSAVDSDRFADGCRYDRFYDEFGLKQDHKAVGVIAQLIHRKGHRHLIGAIPPILAGVPRARFLMFGQGPLRSELERQCHEMGIDGQVQFAGFRSDMDGILPCLDLVVHPADMEGMGVALLESAAAGVPVVASRVGGIPEVVRDGESGYLVDPGRSDQIAARVIELLKNPQLAGRLGEQGRELACTSFSIDGMVSAYMGIYRDIVSQKA